MYSIKFSALTNDNGDSIEAHISSSKKRKHTYPDDEQTLINLTSKRKKDTTSLDTTMGPTSSTGTISKSKTPNKIENLVKIRNPIQTLKMPRVQKTPSKPTKDDK